MPEIKHKKKLLNEIKNEVKDFHPLLHDLFPLMKNIEEVEYSHGQNEMGADFILHKRDTTLSSIKYIGIVAKVGKLAQGDIPELERQIDECKELRNVSSGTQKSYLSEIWVITTGTISTNAKDRIHSKFSNLSVEFIAQDKLISLIDKHTPYIWHDVPNNVGKYLLNLWKNNEIKDISSSLINLNDERVYIELDLFEKQTDYQNNKSRHKINIYSEIENEDVLYIEADMGFGKSKLLSDIINTYSTAHKYYESKILPIFCTFSELHELHEGKVESLIENTKLSNNIEDINDLIFLVLVDGLDELNIDDEELYIDLLESNINYAKETKNTKLIFASRPVRAFDEATISSKVKYFGIKPISISKLIKFFEKICTSLNLSSRLIEDIKSSNLFHQLPQNPIAAILISKLLSENSRELPSNLTELYSQALELMLGRWDIDKGLFTLKEYEAADSISCIIGKYIIENSLSMISIDEAKSMFKSYLNDRNLEINHKSLFDKVVYRSGVYIVSEDNNTITFKHRSFAEYFCAKQMFKTHKNIVDDRVFTPYWTNTFFFYIGLLRDCPDLLQEIFDRPTSNLSERWFKFLNMPHFLLAGYSSPYNIVEDNLYKLLLDYSKFYKEIIDNEIDTNLTKFPELTILWLFQTILRENLSYEYFKKAMSMIPIQISDSVENEATKQYALFFTGAICLEHGDDEPFKFLLETYETSSLPAAVNVGLDSEMKLHTKLGKSVLMKKHRKNFKRLLKGTNIKRFIDNIQNKSIKFLKEK